MDEDIKGRERHRKDETKNKNPRAQFNKVVLVGIFGLLISGYATTQKALLRKAVSTGYRTVSSSSHGYLKPIGASQKKEKGQDGVEPPDPFTQEEVQKRRLGKNESFAACLMVIDENHRLPEWLAYHYHALPLRHLVIHPDPRSSLDVTPLLNEWRHTLGNDFTFDVWNDKSFTDNEAQRQKMKVNMSWGYNQRMLGHRLRQSQFYQRCAVHLHETGYHWTIFYDADEYLTLSSEFFGALKRNLNKERGQKKSETFKFQDSQTLLEQPGIVLKVLSDMRSPNITEYRNTINFSRFKAPQSNAYNSSVFCLTLPRARYSSVDIDVEEHRQYRSFDPRSDNSTVIKQIPNHIEINITNLDTMRFRMRQTPIRQYQGPGKSIIDVSRLDLSKNKLKRGNAHRPLLDVCPQIKKGDLYGPPWEIYGHRLPLGIHHYYGTLEAHMYKQDWRGGESQLERFQNDALYQNKSPPGREMEGSEYEVSGANVTQPERGMVVTRHSSNSNITWTVFLPKPFRDDDEICSWLSGFVKNVGKKRAEYLLRNAQYLPPKEIRHNNNHNEKS